MHPVLKRILLNGALTAVMLELIGLMFVRLSGIWMAGKVDNTGKPTATAAEMDVVRIQVPLVMAFWGFVFVAVGELIRWRLFGKQPAKTTEPPPPDETEKLLNELLTQAESRVALEQEAAKKETGDRGQESGVGGQESGVNQPASGVGKLETGGQPSGSMAQEQQPRV